LRARIHVIGNVYAQWQDAGGAGPRAWTGSWTGSPV